jgi:hypothetical protein
MKKYAPILIGLLIFCGTAAAQSNETSRVQVSPTVEITEYSFEGNNVTIVFDSDIPARIALVDQNSFSQTGASKPNIKTTQLTGGTTTVNFQLEAGRFNTVFISQGTEGFAVISSRSPPLFQNVYEQDLFMISGLTALAFLGQFMGRRYWNRLRLGYGLRWEG